MGQSPRGEGIFVLSSDAKNSIPQLPQRMLLLTAAGCHIAFLVRHRPYSFARLPFDSFALFVPIHFLIVAPSLSAATTIHGGSALRFIRYSKLYYIFF